MGQWFMVCPTGGVYEAECKYKGHGDVDCHIVRTIKPCGTGTTHPASGSGPDTSPKPASLKEAEEEYARSIVKRLAQKYNVPEPEIRFVDRCPTEPTQYGLFQREGGKSEIVLCRGGADHHKILHEFFHYLQSLAGKPLDEAEAESFALREAAAHPSAEKTLYAKARYNRSSEGSMTTWKEVGIIYGGQHIAKGLERGFVEIDRYMEREAAAVQERPSTWLNVGLGVALPFIAVIGRVKSPYDMLLALMGGHFSTKIWDYVEEASLAMAPKTSAGAVFVPAGVVRAPAAAPAPAPAPSPVPAGGVVF
jgi:hypothetical protein